MTTINRNAKSVPEVRTDGTTGTTGTIDAAGTAKRHPRAIAGTLAAVAAAGTAALVLLRRRHRHQHATLRARTVAHARKAKSTLGTQRRKLAHRLH